MHKYMHDAHVLWIQFAEQIRKIRSELNQHKSLLIRIYL